ncbi:MAG: hypothetical protein C5B59_04285 [Bacteroidetes bacterium]|nr:MAG: hypothetical protein C5B59_04285 [Bacteroidota bacterium]
MLIRPGGTDAALKLQLEYFTLLKNFIYSAMPRSTKRISRILSTCLLLLFQCPNLFAQNSHDSLKNADLFLAIRSGSSPEMIKQLDLGASPNAVSGDYSALMAASLYGTPDQMKILLNRGADINYLNKDSITALWMAVPDWEKSNLLLDHGANPASQSKEGYTVLYKLVIFPGSAPLLKRMLEMGVDPKRDRHSTMLLFNAVQSCDTNVVSQLLATGLNPDDSVFYGEYALNSALFYRCSDVVKQLVDHGANVNVCPKHFKNDFLNGITPLMNAAISNDKESILYLLNHGADPNAKSKKGFTAFMFLQQAEYDNPEMTLAFIQHGANVSEKAADGTDALYYALKKGNTESVEIIRKSMH